MSVRGEWGAGYNTYGETSVVFPPPPPHTHPLTPQWLSSITFSRFPLPPTTCLPIGTNRPKSLLEGGACADTFTLIAVPVVFHQAPLARFSCEALGCLMPRWSVRSHASRRMLRRSGRRGGPMILEAGTQQPGEHTLEGVGDQAVYVQMDVS